MKKILIGISLIFIFAGFCMAAYEIPTENFDPAVEDASSPSFDMFGSMGELDSPPQSSPTYKAGSGFVQQSFPNGLVFSPIVLYTLPGTVPNNAVASVIINGANFAYGLQTILTRVGQTNIPGTNVEFMNDQQAKCDFDVSGKAVGAWDVVVINQDGSISTLESALILSFPSALKIKVVGTPRNYPNPFNPETQPTKIRYELSRNAGIELSIFNSRGQRLWYQAYDVGEDPGGKSGINEILWDGQDKFSQTVPNGIYVYHIGSEGKTLATGKIAVFR